MFCLIIKNKYRTSFAFCLLQLNLAIPHLLSHYFDTNAAVSLFKQLISLFVKRKNITTKDGVKTKRCNQKQIGWKKQFIKRVKQHVVFQNCCRNAITHYTDFKRSEIYKQISSNLKTLINLQCL